MSTKKVDKPLVSIALTTKNEETRIKETLMALVNQTYENIEIIVTDDCSTDGTAEMAKLCGVDKVVVKKTNIAEGKNNSARNASGKYLVFLNADVVLESDWIENAVKRFEKGDSAMLIGTFSPIEINWKTKLLTSLFSLYTKVGVLLNGSGVMGEYTLFLPKSNFDKIGGYNERLFCFEDSDFGYRIRKLGRIIIERSCRSKASFRRFENDGYIKWLHQWSVIYTQYHLTKTSLKHYPEVR